MREKLFTTFRLLKIINLLPKDARHFVTVYLCVCTLSFLSFKVYTECVGYALNLSTSSAPEIPAISTPILEIIGVN